MSTQYEQLFSRNAGVISPQEQEKLRKAKIAIAGVGSVGGLLVERLVRLGVGCLKITDPGTFEKSAFNRQFGSSYSNLGRNKAEVVHALLKDINPEARIEFDRTGIKNESDAKTFVAGYDLVIDEMDFGMFRQSIGLQRAARRQGIYYLFSYAIGYGAMTVIFAPGGQTLEEYDSLPVDVDLSKLSEIHIPLNKVVPIIPSYAPADSPEALEAIYAGKRAVPTTSIGVGLASILAANEALNIILRKREIVAAPKYTYIDLIDRKFTTGEIT